MPKPASKIEYKSRKYTKLKKIHMQNKIISLKQLRVWYWTGMAAVNH